MSVTFPVVELSPMAVCYRNASESPPNFPSIYLAGKVGGDKWEIAAPVSRLAKFHSSDGTCHSEHAWGWGAYGFEELNNSNLLEWVVESALTPISSCDLLVAYLDIEGSYGSVAEIAYAVALGKPCHVIILLPEVPQSEEGYCGDGPMFNAYWFISSFPNVTRHVVSSKEQAIRTLNRIVSLENEQVCAASFIDKLESPIEKQFILAFFQRLNFLTFNDEGAAAVHASIPFTIKTQVPVSLAKNYRLDFLLESADKKLVVETDGHDFHERTKEQARRDKERDRALVAAGYMVMRFTGQEVYQDADKCAREVLDFIGGGK
jgi:very-short-patch-repair endonuclease